MAYKYDIAISFAGEDRQTAQRIAALLKTNQIKVFFDEFEEANLLGENLYEKFHTVYTKEAKFCIILVSDAYNKKTWTSHERRSAQERALTESSAYILPLRLDDTSLPGLHSTTGYYDLRRGSVEDFVEIVLKKLGSASKKENENTLRTFSGPLPTVKKVFSDRDKHKFIAQTFETIKKYFHDGIDHLNFLGDFEGDVNKITENRFTCKLYKRGKMVSGCTIWSGSSIMSEGNSICYSNNADQERDNSTNETINVQIYDDHLGLALGWAMFVTGKKSDLTKEEAAEYLWTKVIEPLNE
jgi:hypothetical protein